MVDHDDAWQQVAQECPRRIISTLHVQGHYIHGTSDRFPGKVLCCRREAVLPDGWTPTAAQLQAWQVDQEQAAAPSCDSPIRG